MIRTALRRRLTLPVVGLAAALLLALGAGALIANDLAWGGKEPTVHTGEALLHVRSTGFTSFDGEDGTQAAFHAASVAREASGTGGNGDPPCLRVGAPVPVEVGLVWIELPDGGAVQQVVWLRCLS